MSRPALPPRVRIVEVGPRDGLQNEAAHLDAATKIAFVDALARTGLTTIEVAAFVSPRWVPQMADASQVAAGAARQPGVTYSALVPNERGLEAALAAGIGEIAIVAAASETFSRKNINEDIESSLVRYGGVVRAAAAAGVRVRAYLSTAFGCPYEGAVDVARVVTLAERLVGLGACEVAVSDTIGVAHPGQVWDVIDALAARLPLGRVAMHFHDTRGTALANVLAALQAGVTTFDASAGGLGGCPYAPGAAGNLATEDLVFMLDGLGIETGVRVADVAAASLALEPHLGHALPSRYVQATRGETKQGLV